MAKSYPLAKPYITDKEITAVRQVLKSGVLSLGPKAKEFEQAFARKIGTRFACAVSSGTAGLHLAMLAAGIKEGDEVITSPFSFIASANAALYVGAKPVFVDIDPVSYNLDPGKIEEKITKRTKAILPVHVFGQSADMGPIMKLAKRYRLKVIEDCCESILASHEGTTVGTFGHSAVFAFYANKQMTTGEGGMLVTDDEDAYKLCLSLRNQGRSENMQWLDHERLGYNYRLNELSAALGLAQLQKIDKMIQRRRQVAEMYNACFKEYGELVQIPRVAPGNVHTWFVYVLKIADEGIDREAVIEDLAAQGVASKPYLPSIHLFKFYRKKFGYRPGDFPVSENVSRSTFALPFYVGLTREDVRVIAGRVVSTIKKHARLRQ